MLIPDGSRFEIVVRADNDTLGTDDSVAETVRVSLLREDEDNVSDDLGDVDGKLDEDSDFDQPDTVGRGVTE